MIITGSEQRQLIHGGNQSRGASDHRPVWVDLDLDPVRAPGA